MHSDEERIALLHERASILLHRRQKKKLILSGAALALLSALLIAVSIMLFRSPHLLEGGTYSAASLLSDYAGGYVLAGVIAFISGVAVTIICIRLRKMNNRNQEPENTNRMKKTGGEK